MKYGYQVLPEFVIVQHSSDRQILENIKASFGCGYIKTNHGDSSRHIARKQSHPTEPTTPLLEKHKPKTKKRLDPEKSRKMVKKMELKEHLTDQGFNDIRKIVQEMRFSLTK